MDLTAENFKQLQAKNARLEVENRFLKLKLQAALGKLFGCSSEKISPDQLALEFGVDSVAPGTPEAESEVEEVAVPRKTRKHKPLSERIPEDLPVEEVVIEPKEVLADPEAFKRIGEEVTEELDVVPTKFFKRRTGRASECLDKTLKGFKGIVQSDGYSAYGAFKKRHPAAEIEYAACWAHARRKFHEAHNESPLAAQTLFEIQGLYQIEADLRANPKHDRRSVRQEKSLPILKRIGLQLQLEQAAHLPKSQTGKAIHYTLKLGDKLLIYTEHAQVEIDNNLVENAIRPTAIGKKNWLFFGSAEAGRTSAIHYTLLETCRKLGLNPEEYLRDILPRLPHMTNRTARNYTPAAWKADRENQQG